MIALPRLLCVCPLVCALVLTAAAQDQDTPPVKDAKTPALTPDPLVPNAGPSKNEAPVRAPAAKTLQGATYKWVDKQVYRFSFDKRIKVAREDGSERLTKITGVLVFFIDKIENDGTALATMQLDSPTVKLPPYMQYDNDMDKAVVDDKTQVRLEKAVEEALRVATWTVRLTPEGHVNVLRRDPPSYDEWLLKMRRAAGWLKKLLNIAEDILADKLKLGPGTSDAELLVALAPLTRAEPLNLKSLEALRPMRTVKSVGLSKDERLQLSLERRYADGVEPGMKVRIPQLSTEDVPVAAVLGELKNKKGEAVFDVKMGMLDSMSETFTAQTTMMTMPRRNPQRMEQTVEVTFRLKRLIPVLRTQAPPEKTP